MAKRKRRKARRVRVKGHTRVEYGKRLRVKAYTRKARKKKSKR